jgi:thiamine-phosphate diphosphorylase
MLAERLRLMVLADAALIHGRDAVDLCRRAVAGGATMIQVRWKDGTAADLLQLARACVGALPVPVIVNDRVDVALAAAAAGAHLGQDDLPLAAIRPQVPAGFILGISVGSPDEAARAAESPADYWSIGPCYRTTTKTDAGSALGRAGFAALARLAPPAMPVIGIGGITPANAAAIIAAGAAGVAVGAGVLAAADPEAAARAMRRG